MKLIDKIKNALFEDEIEEEKPVIKKDTIAKKIDLDKTSMEIQEETKAKEKISTIEYKKEEKIKGPIIFDDEDFLIDMKEKQEVKVEPVKKEEKILYGGYDNKDRNKNKEKFKPSPVLSPVYGVVDGALPTEERKGKTTLEHFFVEEKKPTINLDTVRQKAYGDLVKEEEPKEKENLLYDMESEDKVGINRITLGDAEEYFNDLGLEYNIDYKDVEKEKMTRSTKNKELVEIVEEEIKENERIKEELEHQKDDDDVDEKNLYDLIDMMYDNKE